MNTVVFCKIKSKDFEEKTVFVTRVTLPASESQHVSDMFITKLRFIAVFRLFTESVHLPAKPLLIREILSLVRWASVSHFISYKKKKKKRCTEKMLLKRKKCKSETETRQPWMIFNQAACNDTPQCVIVFYANSLLVLNFSRNRVGCSEHTLKLYTLLHLLPTD